MRCQMFIIPVRVGLWPLLLLILKLAWKTANLLALVTAKCFDLTLLYINNQHPFLQHHASMFFLASDGKIDLPDHLSLQIYIENHSNINLCHIFYLKADLYHTEPLRSQMDVLYPLFWVTNGSTPACVKSLSSWLSKVVQLKGMYVYRYSPR